MDKISVATAIRRVKSLKGKIAEHTTRVKGSVVFVDGKEPAFSFQASMDERTRLVRQLLSLEVAIAAVNAQGSLPGSGSDTSVLWAIRRLAELRSEIALLRELTLRVKPHETEVEEYNDYDLDAGKSVRREKKTHYVCAFTQAQRAERVEELQTEFEALNARLEAFNHLAHVAVSSGDGFINA